jgi:hypothetical protein
MNQFTTAAAVQGAFRFNWLLAKHPAAFVHAHHTLLVCLATPEIAFSLFFSCKKSEKTTSSGDR